MVGAADPASNSQTDGTITIYVAKSAVGNPQPGDLLGAVNGRTFTADTPATNTVERSTLFVDHTFCKGQADNGYPAATYTIAGNGQCPPFIEQVVNSLVSLQVSNPSFSAGIASYNLTITNTSSQTIYTPLHVDVAAITAGVTVANADNGTTGAGASWDYSSLVGADLVLTPGETSGARNLRFNDPSGGPFTVTYNVIGNLARSTGSSGSMGRQATGGGEGGGGSGAGSAETLSVADAVSGLVFKVTYNPLLNILTVELLQP